MLTQLYTGTESPRFTTDLDGILKGLFGTQDGISKLEEGLLRMQLGPFGMGDSLR